MDRRSPASYAARALVATKAEREDCEAELESLPSWRMRRRTELERKLERVREREEALLKELGGSPHGE